MLSKFLNNKQKVNYRRKGNQARDARDWPNAVSAYTKHLEENNGDQAIWVQLGHAWKEQGLLDEAVHAYQMAVDLDSDDADANIHLADLLRRLDRSDEALAAYQRVNNVTPNAEAIRNIRLLRKGSKASKGEEIGDGTIFFAIQDLFGYLKAHVTMSGIQRVQAGIALHAIKDEGVKARFIVGNSLDQVLPSGEFWMADNAEVSRIIEYASGKQVDHEVLRALIASCENDAVRVRPSRGSTIILLGAFWGLGNSIREFIRSKRDGVRIGAYVYDIIPVTHPEFCDEALVTDFSMAICELCAVADFILTISDASRFALADFVAKNSGRPIPMQTVPLAHHLTQSADDDAEWPEQLRRVKGKRYVAYVSTIEARKNHLYVVNVWRRLMAEGVDVPDLVFVGRHGWKISGLMDVLKATDNLNGRLHIAHNLSDGELNAVYANCEFSVFTSFVEGWGLPVGESLLHGRPCIASDTSSIPEVGGDLVDYVDPFNLTQGVEIFRRMITDKSYRDARANMIRDQFVPTTWHDVGKNFLDKIKSYQDVDVVPFQSGLEEGKVLSLRTRVGSTVDTKSYFHLPRRILIESAHLYASEDHGIWMKGSKPSLSILTGMPGGTSLLVYLQISVAPGAEDCILSIFNTANDAMRTIRLQEVAQGQVIRLMTEASDDGLVRLSFDVAGSYRRYEVDNRDFVIGLRSIGYATPDNLVARQELYEAMSLVDLTS